MGFANGRQTENFKISLKSPNTLKNSTPPSSGSSAGHGMPVVPGSSSNPLLNAASLSLGPAISILPNVTSTNPKTPSPSTHEVILINDQSSIAVYISVLKILEFKRFHRAYGQSSG